MSNGEHYQATGLEKIYNSILPFQQWAYRAARAYQDEDVDFWSEEGMMDMSLIPLLGYFDSDRHDVSAREMVERLPDSWGLDPNDGTTQFLTSLATDPAMYVGTVLTAAAKTAVTLTKALRVPALTKVLSRNGIKATSLIGKNAPKVSNVKMLSHIDEAIKMQTRVGAKGGRLRGLRLGKEGSKTRGLHHLQKAREAIVKSIDDGVKNVPGLRDVDKRAELIFGIGLGIPFGSRKANLFSKTVKTDKQFWMTYALGGVGKGAGLVAKGAGNVFAPLAAKFPQIGEALAKVVRPMVAAQQGIATSGEALFRGTGDLKPEQLTRIQRHNSDVANSIYKHLNLGKASKKVKEIVGTFDSYVKNRRGDDKFKRAFIKALTGGRGPRGNDAMLERYEEVLRSFLDIAPGQAIPDLDGKTLRKLLTTDTPLFRQRWVSANKELQGGLRTLEATRAGELRSLYTGGEEAEKAGKVLYPKSLKTFDFFRKWSGRTKEAYTVGGSTKVLKEANEQKVKNDNLFQNHLVEVAKEYTRLLAKDAKKIGIDGKVLDNMLGRIAQSTIRTEEVAFVLHELNKGGLDSNQIRALGSSLLDVVNRIEDTVASRRLIGSAGSDNQVWKNIIDEVSSRFAATGNRKSIAEAAAEFKGNKVFPGASDAESLAKQGAARQSIFKLPNDIEEFGGRFIAELTDEELFSVLQTVSKKFKPDKLSNSNLLRFYQARGSHNVANIDQMRTKLGLNAISMFKLLEKVQKGTTPKRLTHYDDLFGVGPGKAKAKAGRRLTEAEQLELIELGRGQIAPDQSALVDISKLTDNQKDLFSALNETIMARRAGFDKGPFIPRPVADRDVLNARVVDEILDPELGEFGAALGKLALLGGELKRIAKAAVNGEKATVGPAFIRQMEEALEFSSQTFDDVVRATLNEYDEAVETLDFMQKVQRDTLLKAVENGNATIGMPFAYLGRVFSRSKVKEMISILSGKHVENYLKEIMPTQSGQFARGYSDITVEELNDIIHAYKNDPPAMESKAVEPMIRLEKLFSEEAVRAGFDIDANKKFVEGAFFPTIHRYAQELANETNIHYSHKALNALNDSKEGVAGKIIGHVRDGKQHIFGTRKSLAVKFSDETEAVIEKSTTPISGQSTAILIKDVNGKIQPVVMADLTHSSRTAVLLDEGEDIHSIFALRAMRGPLREGDQIKNRIESKTALEKLANKNIVLGEAPAIQGMFTALHDAHRTSGTMGMLFDSLTYRLKQSQTVLRPAFSMLNLASVPSQLMTAGIQIHHIPGAFSDTLRFLTLNPDSWGKYERLNLHEGEKLLGFIPRTKRAANLDFVQDLQSVGLEKIIKEGPEAFDKKYPDVDFSDWDFHLGNGTSISMSEMFEDWSRGGMFTTFAREGLGVGRNVSFEVLRIWNATLGEGLHATGFIGRTAKRIKDKKGLGGAALLPAKAVVHTAEGWVNATTKLAEATEVSARLTSYFAALRQGHTSKEAVELTLTCMVDYGKHSKWERNVIKRIIPYYTFQRHYLPAAARYYATSPQRMAMHAKLANDAGLREERGRLMYDSDISLLGKEWSMDVTRMVPLLEALKFVEFGTEVLRGTGRVFGMEEEQSRRERLDVRTPSPVTAGTIFAAGAEVLMADDPDREPLQKFIDGFWQSRFIYDGADDPLKEETPGLKALSILLPIKKRDREAERASIKRRFAMLKNNINNRIDRAKYNKDWDQVYRLQEELGRLQDLKTDRLRGTNK